MLAIYSGTTGVTRIYVYKERKLTNIGEVEETSGPIALSPNGKYLVAGAGDDSIGIFDVANENCAAVLEGHHGQLEGFYFVPNSNGRKLVSYSLDNTIRVWDIADIDSAIR